MQKMIQIGDREVSFLATAATPIRFNQIFAGEDFYSIITDKGLSDNLERALNQPTEDAAYKKGVEMTMNELVKIFTSLGVEIFGACGDEFDPNLHNAVMHIDSEELGENTIAQVFQKGFKIGEKVVRFAMVQVAN